MQIAKVLNQYDHVGLAWIRDGQAVPLERWPKYYWPDDQKSLSHILHHPDPERYVRSLAVDYGMSLDTLRFAAPIDRQEVWAAGVTYQRSKVAREEESAGAAQFYDKVYTADRPELFLKSTPERVVHPGKPIRVRRDGKWNVPEPELALVVNPELKIVGYTIGNDVSSRDIEGENPLYLPQAKVYDGACSVGPVVTLAGHLPPLDKVGIHLTIRRGGAVAYEGHTSADRITRTFESLVQWLGREYSFPNGAVLLTGTGIVPPDDFSLAVGDVVDITIDGIGTLSNPVGP
jgi:2-dehydro-3-deoxy-D-arabinonate dehydratase